jgi:hypothetical protein
VPLTDTTGYTDPGQLVPLTNTTKVHRSKPTIAINRHYVSTHIQSKKKNPRKITQTENRLSVQNHNNENSQTKKNKAIRNEITAKSVTQAAPTKNKERKINKK